MKLKLLLFILSISHITLGQDAYNKISKKLCKCLEERQIQSPEEMQPCIEKSIFENIQALLDFHEIESLTEIDVNEMIERILAKLSKNCDYLNTLTDDSTTHETPEYQTDTLLNCGEVKTGEFYYTMPSCINQEIMDTTYVTITDKEYIERMKMGKTYSRLKIKWDDHCSFTLTFIESNDPFKNSLSKPGDKYHYEVIQNHLDYMVVKLVVKDQEYFSEFVKLH